MKCHEPSPSFSVQAAVLPRLPSQQGLEDFSSFSGAQPSACANFPATAAALAALSSGMGLGASSHGQCRVSMTTIVGGSLALRLQSFWPPHGQTAQSFRKAWYWAWPGGVTQHSNSSWARALCRSLEVQGPERAWHLRKVPNAVMVALPWLSQAPVVDDGSTNAARQHLEDAPVCSPIIREPFCWGPINNYHLWANPEMAQPNIRGGFSSLAPGAVPPLLCRDFRLPGCHCSSCAARLGLSMSPSNAVLSSQSISPVVTIL